ncbi:FMN-dependent NADH-azoreductase [Azospirillum lipoferum]|uniref:FMN dependent NADH:quinone oxidoreductase n=1 Tax=Azospirillum lipoferum TaxID=193 RepID=A0A5A9GTD1_AZOLI|nr:MULTISPECIES: FMN-dependent NADH-azoreductase [Azospirillum]KAA0597082.1 FMN-dependent NADH-azoreductase [Azospirillum lipoferum]MCP1608574.1 FMN-dependent NADH-azoreductase [Azospirillum lipoferum]MDW5536108.1 FMN-dependent NADH-azoreductase [Azospirillum sp. NL1]
MTTILHVDSSPLGTASVTRQLTASIVEALVKADPAASVVTRDVAANPPAHLDAELLPVLKLGVLDGLSERQREELALTNALLDEFLAADIVVVGAPMYNFSVPTQLKAWIDRLAQAGRTFRYTENGPQGLAGGKRVIVASGRGGVYSTNPALAGLDHQEAYLRSVFGFFGITDVSFVRAEGVSMGPEAKDKALAGAAKVIEELIAA